MGISLNKKANKAKAESVDYRDGAKKSIERIGSELLVASQGISDRKSALAMASRSKRTARMLERILAKDNSMETEDAGLFAEIQSAIASFDAISSELEGEVDSLPSPPGLKKEVFTEAVSDGALRLGSTGLVLPKGAVVITPRGDFKSVDDARIVTDEHRAAGGKVKKIIGKHISEKE